MKQYFLTTFDGDDRTLLSDKLGKNYYSFLMLLEIKVWIPVKHIDEKVVRNIDYWKKVNDKYQYSNFGDLKIYSKYMSGGKYWNPVCEYCDAVSLEKCNDHKPQLWQESLFKTFIRENYEDLCKKGLGLDKKKYPRTRRLPDFWCVLENQIILVIEWDENSHRKSFKHRNIDFKELQQKGKKVVLIRFNPDAYVSKDRWIYTPIQERLKKLKLKIDTIIKEEKRVSGTTEMTICYLFYHHPLLRRITELYEIENIWHMKSL